MIWISEQIQTKGRNRTKVTKKVTSKLKNYKPQRDIYSE